MKNDEQNLTISPEKLVMTSEEFKFIRRKLKISQKDVGFLNRRLSQTVISEIEKQKFISPVLAYQLLAGKYAPIQVVMALRSEWNAMRKNVQPKID